MAHSKSYKAKYLVDWTGYWSKGAEDYLLGSPLNPLGFIAEGGPEGRQVRVELGRRRNHLEDAQVDVFREHVLHLQDIADGFNVTCDETPVAHSQEFFGPYLSSFLAEQKLAENLRILIFLAILYSILLQPAAEKPIFKENKL